MAFALVRIDDRLIHGQVALAWGAHLSPDRIVLVNDEVAEDEWKRGLYSETDALGTVMSVLSIDAFVCGAAEGRWDDERIIVIVESPEDLLSLLEKGVEIPTANVGGMHHHEGKRELLSYVYVDGDDVAAMRKIIQSGTALLARDVPQSQAIDLARVVLSAEFD